MNWYKIAQLESGELLYRGDKSFIPFDQLDTIAQFNPREKESLSAFTHTPGLYFTTSKQNALNYGNYLTIVKIKSSANIFNTKNLIDKSSVEKIVKTNPNVNNIAADWDDNTRTGIRMMIDSILMETNPIERIKAIWATVYPNDNRGFSDAMISIGIDGLVVDALGYKHYVIYNKNILDLVKYEHKN